MAEDPIQSALDSFRSKVDRAAKERYGPQALGNVEFDNGGHRTEITPSIRVKIWEKIGGEPYSNTLYYVTPSNPDDLLTADPHRGETPEQGYARYERAVAAEIRKVAKKWKFHSGSIKLGSKMREIPSGFEIPESEREVRRYQKDYSLDRPWKKGAH